MRSVRTLTIAIVLAAVSATSAQTVTVSLSSMKDGQVVQPGATIDWEVSFTVSTGDNMGLALLVCNLEQDANNPETLDIPPAGSVPGGMSNFSRPDGIANPGELNPTTGYTGVQRGTAGAMNLVQIGGAQNTFGQAMSSGSGVAENATLVGGVGQSGSVVLASGTFTAPTACGNYGFSLSNVIANVLDEVNTPPAFSQVSSASVNAAAGSFSFTVGIVGDLDNNLTVDLTDLGVLLGNYGCSGSCAGDVNGDNVVDLTDLGLLLGSYGQSCN